MARSSAIHSLAVWNSCSAQISKRLPDMTQKAKDTYQEIIKKPKPDPKTELMLLSKIYSGCILDASLQEHGK